jgi:CheY-like chemotaxis protein
MSAKRALIVDDSRSARAFLTRILERYDLQVDGAESAAEAIEYLNRQRPDVIFLDHLMPGMDGFQALTVIKNDPRTATIPVMMYTSQEGELYLSQARALGAMGVLPKQTQPADVSRALEQLRLLGERIPESEIATVRVPSLRDAAPAAEGGRGDSLETGMLPTAAGAAPAAGLTPQMRAQLDSLLHDHGIELRRFVTHSLQLHAERIVGDVRALMDEAIGRAGAPAASAPEPAPPPPPRRTSAAIPWLGAAAAAIAVLAGILWYRAANHEQQLAAGPAAVNSALRVGAADVDKSGFAAAPARAALNGAAHSAAARTPPLLVETVPFGESPFAGARIEAVQALLERLSASGFHGTVEIRSYPGRFCMQGGGDGVVLPAADTSYAKCDQVGNPVDSGGLAGRQSVAFANMLSAQRSRSGGGLEVQLAAGSAEDVVAPYPPLSEPLTAGEWNRAAAANNRVEVRTRALP